MTRDEEIRSALAKAGLRTPDPWADGEDGYAGYVESCEESITLFRPGVNNNRAPADAAYVALTTHPRDGYEALARELLEARRLLREALLLNADEDPQNKELRAFLNGAA